MKTKNVKQAMGNDNLRVKNIYSKGSKRIRIDFEPRFPRRDVNRCSFWIDRDYFERNYPNTYNRF